jgi:hypothetical protein
MKIVIGLVALAVLLFLTWWLKRREEADEADPEGEADPGPLDEESMGFLHANAHYLVAGGFHDRQEIVEMLPEVAAVEAPESMLAPIVDAEIARKNAAEPGWPRETDCDRLDAAFAALHAQGIFAQQYVGYTQDEGFQSVAEALAEENEGKYSGFCFFTAQDVEHLLDGDRSLFLAFGDSEEGERAVDVGRKICTVLRGAGYEADWDESPSTRIKLANFHWKRRGMKNPEARAMIGSHRLASR